MSSPSPSQSVVTEPVVAFLQDVPPFQFLSHIELAGLARHATLKFFPKDTVILSAGNTSDALYVVHKGGVKLALRSQVGKHKKSGRLFSAACFGKILRGGGKSYSDGGFALAVGVSLGVCVELPVLVIRRISTRRFLARPSAVLFDSMGLSLPSPIR